MTDEWVPDFKPLDWRWTQDNGASGHCAADKPFIDRLKSHFWFGIRPAMQDKSAEASGKISVFL
jgi:hypothetical protein